MKSLKLLSMIGSLFVFTNCCWLAGHLSELADIVVNHFTAPEEVTSGESFLAIAEVVNKKAEESCTTTDFAGATIDLLEVYRKYANGTRALVGRAELNQEELNPDETTDIFDQITINENGEYDIEFYADFPALVNERSESNNEGEIGVSNLTLGTTALKSGNNFAITTVRVLPNSQGMSRILGKPVVEFTFGTVKSMSDETLFR